MRYIPTLVNTVPIDRILGVKNARAWVSMDFTEDKYSAPRTIEKMKILAAVLELPTKQHCQFSPFGPLSWYCLAGSSKTGPHDFNFFNCPGC